MRKHIALYLVVTIILSTRSSNAQTPEDEIRSLVRAIQSARLELKTGVAEFTGSGEYFRRGREGREKETPRYSLYAFDFPAQKLRFDSHRTHYLSIQSSGSMVDTDDVEEVFGSSDFQLVTSRLNSVRTPEEFVWYEGISKHEELSHQLAATNVEIYQSDFPWPSNVAIDHSLTDPRSFGLIDYWDFEGNPAVTGGQKPEFYIHNCDIDVVTDNILRKWPTKVETDGEFSVLHSSHGREIRINTSQGYTAVKNTENRGELLNSEIQWEEKNGVWVPVEIMLERLNWPDDDGYSRRTYTVEWSHVNEPVPDWYFDFRNFPDVRSGASIMDNRGDTPTQIGTWKDGKFQEMSDPESESLSSSDDSDRTFNQLILINCGLLTAIVVILVLYRRLTRG